MAKCRLHSCGRSLPSSNTMHVQHHYQPLLHIRSNGSIHPPQKAANKPFATTLPWVISGQSIIRGGKETQTSSGNRRDIDISTNVTHGVNCIQVRPCVRQTRRSQQRTHNSHCTNILRPCSQLAASAGCRRAWPTLTQLNHQLTRWDLISTVDITLDTRTHLACWWCGYTVPRTPAYSNLQQLLVICTCNKDLYVPQILTHCAEVTND